MPLTPPVAEPPCFTSMPTAPVPLCIMAKIPFPVSPVTVPLVVIVILPLPPRFSAWMPYPPLEDHRFEVVPDWVCEILSPSTASADREIKLPLCARYGVQYAWLVDPVKRTLEIYRLDAGTWTEVARFADADQVVAPPFEAVSIELKGLWLPQRPRVVELVGRESAAGPPQRDRGAHPRREPR